MKIATKILMTGTFIAMMTACTSGTKEVQLTKSGLDPEKFLTDSTALYTLTNDNGMEVCITNYGARIVSIMVPDKDGQMRDVVFGFDSIQAYFPENNATDFGAAIGRYANRINQGRIVINGDTIQLPQNNYGHCLHGGPNGWQYGIFAAEQPNDSTLVFTLVSPDGDSNFPGTVTATTTYTLTSDNALDIAYNAVTDATTVINMTNHSYFNLNGDPDQLITDNILYVNADYFTPVDSTFMTTGEIAPVAGTPMDFNQPKVVGAEINNYEYDQLNNGKGYDHNWVLNTKGDDSTVAASVTSPTTGIKLEVLTNEPGIQVYAGNFLDGTVTGKGGKVYNKRAAICLETQHYPDSPNKPEWPSVILEPGQTYNSHCVYRFSTVND